MIMTLEARVHAGFQRFSLATGDEMGIFLLLFFGMWQLGMAGVAVRGKSISSVFGWWEVRSYGRKNANRPCVKNDCSGFKVLSLLV